MREGGEPFSTLAVSTPARVFDSPIFFFFCLHTLRFSFLSCICSHLSRSDSHSEKKSLFSRCISCSGRRGRAIHPFIHTFYSALILLYGT